MGGTTGARFWAEQLHAALRPQPPAAATPQPPLTWCAASMPGVGGEPIGPCVLRAGHDGPVHQTATGARWWPVDEESTPAPIDWATVPLTVKVYGPTPRPCDSGRHVDHPSYTCEEVDSDVAAWTRFLDGLYLQAMADTAANTDRVPAPLRGPNASPPAGDPAPLRRLAEQALTHQTERTEPR
ncbi:hypothetical protein V2S66_31495 [Streptomyces sp. V4-01]|uniref:Uncharacterized protein n=1 Tax=Actinacidiphila polyblastidii TaxID=3110430 RepID=A0ABU7PML4_9ACTN|nr:hypothetical protein [Streptomyces sp. V4-01]